MAPHSGAIRKYVSDEHPRRACQSPERRQHGCRWAPIAWSVWCGSSRSLAGVGALLDQLAGAEHKDGVVVDDRREPVGNRAQRDAVKLRPQERLHARVGGPYCTASNREYSIPPTGMCVLKRRSPTRSLAGPRGDLHRRAAPAVTHPSPSRRLRRPRTRPRHVCYR